MRFYTNNMCLLLVIIFSTWTLNGESLLEPIQDHLSDMDPKRIGLVGELDLKSLVHIEKFELDIDGDAINELFVGHGQMWTGDTKGRYFSVYGKQNGKYVRISPISKDLRIMFGGDGGWFYAGKVEEMGKSGLLDVSSPTREDPLYFPMANFYYLEGGKLYLKQMGPIDLNSDYGKRMYERYVKSPSIESSKPTKELSLSSEQLEQEGYDLSSWENSPSDTNPSILNKSATKFEVQSKYPIVQEKAKTEQQKAAPFPWIWFGAIAVILISVVYFLTQRKP